MNTTITSNSLITTISQQTPIAVVPSNINAAAAQQFQFTTTSQSTPLGEMRYDFNSNSVVTWDGSTWLHMPELSQHNTHMQMELPPKLQWLVHFLDDVDRANDYESGIVTELAKVFDKLEELHVEYKMQKGT